MAIYYGVKQWCVLSPLLFDLLVTIHPSGLEKSHVLLFHLGICKFVALCL